MLAQQRHREILKRLAGTGGARVTELARALRVTEETIRRDLTHLSDEGRLVRTHGGAVSVHDDRHDLPFEVRRTANLLEKRAIATHALRHVTAGDVIALDASSTVHEFARLLPNIAITVVTNSLPATVTLASRPQVRVVLTGGMLDTPSRSVVGALAEQGLERFNINKLFLSSKGVDLVRGLSDGTDDQARLKRRMMDLAEKTYLLVDHSKLGIRSVVFFGALPEADVLITDAGAEPDMLEALKQMGLTVETAG